MRNYVYKDAEGDLITYRNEARRGRNLPRAEKKMAKRIRIAVRLGLASQETGLVIRSPRVRRIIEWVSP